jgi:hypothetical protein
VYRSKTRPWQQLHQIIDLPKFSALQKAINVDHIVVRATGLTSLKRAVHSSSVIPSSRSATNTVQCSQSLARRSISIWDLYELTYLLSVTGLESRPRAHQYPAIETKTKPTNFRFFVSVLRIVVLLRVFRPTRAGVDIHGFHRADIGHRSLSDRYRHRLFRGILRCLLFCSLSIKVSRQKRRERCSPTFVCRVLTTYCAFLILSPHPLICSTDPCRYSSASHASQTVSGQSRFFRCRSTNILRALSR